MPSLSVTAAIAISKRLLTSYEVGEIIPYKEIRDLDSQTDGLGWLAIRHHLEEMPVEGYRRVD